MNKVRLGIVGCGFGASALYGSFFRYLENGELVGVTDLDRSRSESFKEQSGAAKVYEDYGTMIDDPEIDAVLVFSPPVAHAEQVTRAAWAGKHVYCEKPMAKTVAEAESMIAACRDCGVKFQIAFMKRFNSSFRSARQAIEDGRIGEVFEMRATWDNARAATSFANYRHNRTSGGGFLQEDGSHPLDVIRWWLGDVKQVSADVMVVAANRFDNEDVANVTMRHVNGCLSTLHITMLTHRTGEEAYEVFGTKGTLLLRWPFHSTRTLDSAILQIHQGATHVTDLTLPSSWNPQEELETKWQYLRELRSFCDCILNDRQPEVRGEDGRAVVEIINAAYISSHEGRKVTLPLSQTPDFDAIFGELRESSRWHISDEDAWWSRY